MIYTISVTDYHMLHTGLKPYNAWRQFCGLPRVTLDYMPDHTRELQYKFARLYDAADDIDLFSAAITER